MTPSPPQASIATAMARGLGPGWSLPDILARCREHQVVQQRLCHRRAKVSERECQRCKGLGFIRECVLRLDDVAPGEPQTATVTEVLDPRECPDCGGSGKPTPRR